MRIKDLTAVCSRTIEPEFQPGLFLRKARAKIIMNFTEGYILWPLSGHVFRNNSNTYNDNNNDNNSNNNNNNKY